MIISSPECLVCPKAQRNEVWNATLELAAEQDSLDIVKVLTVGRADAPINAGDGRKLIKFHLDADKGHVSVVRQLIRLPGIDVNAKREFAKAPLHDAAIRGFIDICRLLLSARGITINASNIWGKVQLHSTNEWRPSGCLSTPQKSTSTQKNNFGAASIHSGSRIGSDESEGIPADTPGDKDKTPIMQAVAHKHERIIDLFLETKGLDLQQNGRPRPRAQL
jgi:ankyrin repeat protein